MNSSNIHTPSLLKINRAKKHLKELEAKIAKYKKTIPFELIKENQGNSGNLLYRIKINKYPPDEWSIIIGDILHNLRSSLDLLITQLTISNGSKPNRKTGFPIYTFKKDFRREGLERIKGVSSKTKQAIKSFKPYRKANRELWELHNLNISDKHKMVIGVGGLYKSLIIDMSAIFKQHYPGSEMPSMPIPIPPKNNLFPLKDRDIVFKGNVQHPDPTIDIDLAFSKEAVMKSTPLIPKLQRFIQMVESIVNNIK